MLISAGFYLFMRKKKKNLRLCFYTKQVLHVAGSLPYYPAPLGFHHLLRFPFFSIAIRICAHVLVHERLSSAECVRSLKNSFFFFLSRCCLLGPTSPFVLAIIVCYTGLLSSFIVRSWHEDWKRWSTSNILVVAFNV